MAARILIVTPDERASTLLKTALVARGLEVEEVRDGRTAVHRAVTSQPAAVVIDLDAPLVGARAFAEVLGHNPRTAGMRVFVLAPESAARQRVAGITAWIETPFNAEEVAARIAGFILADRGDAAERDETRDLTGDFSQISPADLLQLLSANRRTGVLDVVTPGFKGAVFLKDGQVIDAETGGASGRKALYRMLRASEGTFAFSLAEPSRPRRIEGRTEALLMEGMHELDEMRRLEGALPLVDDLLEIADPAPLGETSPFTEDTLSLVRRFERFGDVLDQSPGTDLGTARIVAELIAEGRVRSRGTRSRARLARPEIMSRLRRAVKTVRRPGTEGPARLLWLVPDFETAERFLNAIRSSIEGYCASAWAASRPTGLPADLGTLNLDGEERLEMIAMPLEPAMAPAWGPFLGPVIGGAILCPDEEALDRGRRSRAILLGSGLAVNLVFPSETAPEPGLVCADFRKPDGAAAILTAVVQGIVARAERQ
jgi:CheY-like chemotaxis protein